MVLIVIRLLVLKLLDSWRKGIVAKSSNLALRGKEACAEMSKEMLLNYPISLDANIGILAHREG
jgi:hypothetical protein